MKQKTNLNDPQDELCSAIKARDLSKIDQLLKAKIVPDPDSLLLAITQKAQEILKRLIKAGADVNGWKGGGIAYRVDTPVARALIVGDNVTLKLLLDAGASPNKACAAGPPLVYAAVKGLMESARLLIAASADLEQSYQSKTTPLMVAARMGHLEMVKLLLEEGANPLSVNVAGQTAYDIAVEEKEQEVVRVLAPVSRI
jgi:hypothetical protein